MEGKSNDTFDAEFVNDEVPGNHYMIEVHSSKYSYTIKDKDILNVYKLNDGSKVTYTRISGFNVLIFEKDDWDYILSIDKRVSKKVTAESLIKITNPVKYSS
jgi:hypothetical protein